MQVHARLLTSRVTHWKQQSIKICNLLHAMFALLRLFEVKAKKGPNQNTYFRLFSSVKVSHHCV